MTTDNGHAKLPLPADLKEARREQRLLESQLSILRLTREKKLLESFGWWDGFGGSDLWDRARPRTNDADGGFGRVPPAVPSDHRHGANWPIWRTQIELDNLRNEARVRLETNSYALGLLQNRTNNTIGRGFAYTAELVPALKKKLAEKKRQEKAKLPPAPGVMTPPGAGPPDEPDEKAPEEKLVEAVQAVIDRFLKANRWNGKVDPQTMTIADSREREIYRAVVGDGEAFIRFHPADRGLEVRMLDPATIRDPAGATYWEGWSYGSRHRMEPYEDVETQLEYCAYWPDPSATGGKEGEADSYVSEIIDAREVLHLKGLNTPSLVKRGLSQFLFGVGRSLDRAEKLQENASISAAVRAATAEIWQVTQQTQAQVDGMAAALASRQIVDPVTGQTRNVERRYPGGVRRVPEGLENQPLQPGPTEEYMAGKMGDLQMAGAASCSPAFWLGDTENANYSNLESASAPAVRQGICEQEYFKTAYAAVVWRAVLFAVERGELPEGVEDVVEIHVEAPAVVHRNELEKAQEDQIGVTTGWKDRQTCAEERGLDYETVKERNSEYQEETGGMGGLLPDDEDGGGGPPNKQGGGGGKPPGFPRLQAGG
jgi:hypothetical protein